MTRLNRVSIILLTCALSSAACAETLPQSQLNPAPLNNDTKRKVKSIVIKSNDIFDLSDPETFFIHRWANYLHINTRDAVIREQLSFEKNDHVSQKDLDELQRILRAEPYIRDASITFSQPAPDADVAIEDSEIILVETWDNWSLLPMISVGHSGGESKFSVGIKEDNLFGTGIKTRVKYQSNADRTGYQFGVKAPIKLIKHATVEAYFYDNSDGQATHLHFEKPFYTLKTDNMYSAKYLDDMRVDTLKQNGVDINEFEHAVTYNTARYGWLLNHNDQQLSRIIVGLTQDKHQFENIELYPESALPKNRDFLYPWIAYQYLQDDYQVLKNVHLINYNEDFNLGWQHYIKLGFETRDLRDGDTLGYHIDWQSRRGLKTNNQLLLLEIDGDGVFATRQKDRYKVNFAAEYFYHISPKWTAYSKLRLASSNNNYLDQPLALGDDTGVRGYPNSYQYGDKQWSFTAESRHYPNINLYQLAELGWAVFADVGQATGGNNSNNEESGVIGSVGVGARIYSSKSSYGNVAHIDLSVPFTTGAEVNSWEWRFLVKKHF
ncbi:ShlB/FhaC/HecB family hemolysin secretion/activation protein [Shewanella youngdeokensis]|uniref:Haemolysin activator HlyB C-terminal domain-containing protein n=1 Tax=Shewanella youngdeokensis TaxID=2999068 RepID=A0ABZ0JXS0_9GAMM|nr:hypothetical protein RGE70_17520 [Shewanella sp. DAU334]